MEKYVGFLRGINVGGHHKVPMGDLRNELEKLGFKNVVTLLNSGNVIFEATTTNIADLENLISEHLEKTFGFPIPTIIRKGQTVSQLCKDAPFKDVRFNKDIRWYISFLKESTKTEFNLPWKSADNSFEIIGKSDSYVLSVLDLSVSKTIKAMEGLEKYFGKDITTRNWKTIERIALKL